jgi:hypothetical protein
MPTLHEPRGGSGALRAATFSKECDEIDDDRGGLRLESKEELLGVVAVYQAGHVIAEGRGRSDVVVEPVRICLWAPHRTAGSAADRVRRSKRISLRPTRRSGLHRRTHER